MSTAARNDRIKAYRASYRSRISEEELEGLLPDRARTELLSILSRRADIVGTLTVTTSSSRSAFRFDMATQSENEPAVTVIHTWTGETLLLDHQSRTFRALKTDGKADAPAVEGGPPVEVSTPQGPGMRFQHRPTMETEFQVDLLSDPNLPSSAVWWEVFLPGILPRRYRTGLPFGAELRRSSSPTPLARLELTSLETVQESGSIFSLPEGYRAATSDERLEKKGTVKRAEPKPIDGLPRESAVGALLSHACEEQFKLQMRSDVPERVRAAVNDLSSRLGEITGQGLQLDLAPLLTPLSVAGPNTPPNMPGIANVLLLRAAFWHFGTRLKSVLKIDALLTALETVIEAVDNGDANAGRIEPDPTQDSVSDEDVSTFRKVRDLIVDGGSSFSSIVGQVLDAESRFKMEGGLVDGATMIDALTLESWDRNSIPRAMGRAWFDRYLWKPLLQPEVKLTQRNGRTKGWRKDGYVAEGLEDLIDLDLNVLSAGVDFAGQAVLSPTARLDEADPRFQLIDVLEEEPTPSNKKRAGFRSTFSLNELWVHGSVTTRPTTRSPAIAALILLAPQELLKLSNYVNVNAVLSGLSADLLVYFEQERLSPAPPALKLWIGPLQVQSVEVAGWVVSGDPLVKLVGDIVINQIVEEITPALVDRARRELAAALDSVTGLVADFFGVEPAPPEEPERTTTQTVQDMTSTGTELREEVRLHELLNLNREEEVERLTGMILQRRASWQGAFQTLNQLWDTHLRAGEEAGVDVPTDGFDPRTMPRPIRDRDGAVVAPERVADLQSSYQSWFAQRRVVDNLGEELNQAYENLNAFLDWPEGRTACEAVAEPGGYRVGLSVCRPAVVGRALTHPPPATAQSGDLTLLISTRTFREMTQGSGVAYRGDVRSTDGNPAVLPQLPSIDWWTDAPEPDRLEPRPENLHDGPPDIVMDPSVTEESEWIGYSSVIEVGGRSASLIPVHNPSPDEHVAEIRIVVTVTVGVTTFTPVLMEHCGPDLTKFVGELEHPRAEDLGGPFRPPLGPDGLRPGPDRRVRLSVEGGFQRRSSPLEPPMLTAKSLENMRVRYLAEGETNRELTEPEGVLFSRPALGALFGGDAHCRLISTWDVKETEEWLRARLELRLPVFVGLANTQPGVSVLPGSIPLCGSDVQLPALHRLCRRAGMPVLTYRYAVEPIVPPGLISLEASGPLAGLAEGENRAWLEDLMANHAFALARNTNDRHRMHADNRLNYAYGIAANRLDPEGFTPYLYLAMHPSYWNGATPPPATDRNPPHLAMQTFGPSDEALNLAINFTISESLLDKLGA